MTLYCLFSEKKNESFRINVWFESHAITSHHYKRKPALSVCNTYDRKLVIKSFALFVFEMTSQIIRSGSPARLYLHTETYVANCKALKWSFFFAENEITDNGFESQITALFRQLRYYTHSMQYNDCCHDSRKSRYLGPSIILGYLCKI